MLVEVFKGVIKYQQRCTLEYGINVHVRLLIFGKNSHLYALIPTYILINFWDFVLDQE